MPPRNPFAGLYDRVLEDLAKRVAAAASTSPQVILQPVPHDDPDPMVAQVEWEPLAKALTIADVTRIGEQRGHFGVFTFRRGDQYEIVGTFHSASSTLGTSLIDGTPGLLTNGIPVEGFDECGRLIRVPNVVFSGFHRTDDQSGSRLEMSTKVWRVERTLDDSMPTTVVDWFISGPHETGSLMCRRTERTRHRGYVRERKGPPRGQPDLTDIRTPGPPALTQGSSSWDYMIVPAGAGRRAIVALVPDGHGPSWSKCLAIEYRPELGGTPTDEVRESLCDILGFVLGRHILHVGTSAFDEGGFVLRDAACEPWGRDVVETCGDTDRPPIPLPSKGSNGTEVLVGPLIDRYLLLEGELDLGSAIWTVWAGERMPVTFDLPLFSAALERVMNAWFKSTKTKTRGIYMPKRDFEELLADELAAAEVKLKSVSYGDRIGRRMRGAFNMGANERYELFLQELGLPYGEGELAALRGRNAPAHGGTESKGDRWIRLGAAYRVLFNRIVLKLLGYDGRYIDYSVLGHPARPLAEPIGYRPG